MEQNSKKIPDVFKNSVDEQETIIAYSRDSEQCTIYTSDNTELTRFRKLLKAENSEWEITETFQSADGAYTGIKISGPKDLVTIRLKHKEMSEENMERLRNRFKETN